MPIVKHRLQEQSHAIALDLATMRSAAHLLWGADDVTTTSDVEDLEISATETVLEAIVLFPRAYIPDLGHHRSKEVIDALGEAFSLAHVGEDTRSRLEEAARVDIESAP